MTSRMQISPASGGVLALAVAGLLAAGPAFSASPPVEAAIKSLEKIQADAGKFQSYCNLLGEMQNVPETDMAKADALEGQLEDLVESIGADVAQAWELAAATPTESEDGKAFAAAFDALETKCP